MQTEWAFKGGGLGGHDALLDRYPDEEFNSPTRSTIPLLEYWRSPEQRIRELNSALGLPVPPRVQLNFEHTVCPPRGRGNPSHTDLMAISLPDLAIAIEAKWTEQRYQIVGKWLRDSANRKEGAAGLVRVAGTAGGEPDTGRRFARIAVSDGPSSGLRMPRKGRVELLARLSGVRADSEKAFRIPGGSHSPSRCARVAIIARHSIG